VGQKEESKRKKKRGHQSQAEIIGGCLLLQPLCTLPSEVGISRIQILYKHTDALTIERF